MLEALFSFRGRINRLQYFGWGLALAGAMAVLAIPLVVLMIGAHVAGAPAVGLIALIVAPPFLWASFALQAKRFRDIGWNPVYVIPAWIAIDAVDLLVAKTAPMLAVGALHTHTLIGVLANLILGGSLLFWPGRADDGAPTVVDADWSRPPEPAPAVRPTSSAPAASVHAPVWNAAPQQTGFGRRGL
jgi:uncharacterized membrane protein YhaH (DUF805 family)